MVVDIRKNKLINDPVLKKIIEVIVNTVQPDKIILFGSRAKGTHSELSDYDLLILKSGIKPEDRRPLQRKIRDALRNAGIWNAIDVIVQSPQRFDYLSQDPFLVYHDIKKHSTIIYEKRV